MDDLVNATCENVLLEDDTGKTSAMVKIPKFKISDVIEGAPDVIHPAFVVNGEEKDYIYISKYQNIVDDNRAYSIAGRDPAVLLTIKQADQYCRNKGKGWHLLTCAEWSAIALLSARNNTIPHGNNDNGSDWEYKKEKGVLGALDAVVPEGEIGPPMRVLTGSGPNTWSHDWTSEGIFDLNGNIWEMTMGTRLENGVLKISTAYSLSDAEWCDVNAYTLKPEKNSLHPIAMFLDNGQICYKAADSAPCSSDEAIMGLFSETKINNKTIKKGNVLEQLCIVPHENRDSRGDVVWAVPDDIRYPIRGGYWVNKEKAGINTYGFYMRTDDRYYDVGFRCSYVE